MALLGTTIENTVGRGLTGFECILTVAESRFVSNTATVGNGGAVSLTFDSSFAASEAVFEDNVAKGDGGAIACSQCVKLEISQTEFRRNTGARKGLRAEGRIAGRPALAATAGLGRTG